MMLTVFVVMCSREVGDCKKAGPYECSAEMGGRGAIGPPVGFSVRFFNWVCGYVGASCDYG